MRARVVVVFGLVAATARADLEVAEASARLQAMDGPVASPCAVLAKPGERCVELAKIGSGDGRSLKSFAVFWVAPAAYDVEQRTGNYYVAVHNEAGWMISHEALSVAAYWREHGPGHTQVVGRPQLTPLALASRRPAVALRLPISVYLDSCNDVALPAIPKRCKSDRPSRGSPVALLACGERADGRWACTPALQTLQPHDPPLRFARDGRLEHDDAGLFGFGRDGRLAF